MSGICAMATFFGGMLYLIHVWLSYSGKMEGTPRYIVGFITSGTIALCWYWLVSQSDKGQIYKYAISWDLMAAIIFMFGPLIMFGINLTPKGIVGILVMSLGVYLVCTSKVGS